MAFQTLAADLHVACVLNDSPRVKHLLTLGAHRNAQNASGTTALQLADFLRRVEIVKILLHDVDTKEEGGCELLRAIRMNQATVVQALLEMGVREELEGDEGFFRGALVLTCCVSNVRVLDALVRFGPGVGVVGSIQDVLVQCALVGGNLEVVDGIREIVADERGIDMVCYLFSFLGTMKNVVADLWAGIYGQ